MQIKFGFNVTLCLKRKKENNVIESIYFRLGQVPAHCHAYDQEYDEALARGKYTEIAVKRTQAYPKGCPPSQQKDQKTM